MNVNSGDFSKNEKQLYYNQVKGVICEFNEGEPFSNITLSVGFDKTRHVNIVIKKEIFLQVLQNYELGDKVCIKYYLVSKKKFERWYTNATFLDIELISK